MLDKICGNSFPFPVSRDPLLQCTSDIMYIVFRIERDSPQRNSTLLTETSMVLILNHLKCSYAFSNNKVNNMHYDLR